MNSDIAYGDAIKAMDEGKVGGYLVRFSTSADPDLSGEYFTAKTYFGPRDGDGADLMFNHGIPIKAELSGLADRLFAPIATKKDDVGIWADAVLDLSDAYEKKIYELAKQGKLGWSSGAAAHMVKRAEGGEIKRWPIAEGSITPIPAEPRNKIVSVKSLQTESIKSQMAECTNLKEIEALLRDAGGYSRTDACALVSRIKSIAHGERDAEVKQAAEIAALFQRFK